MYGLVVFFCLVALGVCFAIVETRAQHEDEGYHSAIGQGSHQRLEDNPHQQKHFLPPPGAYEYFLSEGCSVWIYPVSNRSCRIYVGNPATCSWPFALKTDKYGAYFSLTASSPAQVEYQLDSIFKGL